MHSKSLDCKQAVVRVAEHGWDVCRGEEVLELLQKPTAKENAVVEKFRTGGASVREYCPHLTKEACRR